MTQIPTTIELAWREKTLSETIAAPLSGVSGTEAAGSQLYCIHSNTCKFLHHYCTVHIVQPSHKMRCRNQNKSFG